VLIDQAIDLLADKPKRAADGEAEIGKLSQSRRRSVLDFGPNHTIAAAAAMKTVSRQRSSNGQSQPIPYYRET
jgi:hypothetical protein